MAYILALFAGTFISLALGLPTSPSQLDTEQLFSKRDTVCYPENMENYVSRYDCIKKYTVDKDGHCSSPIPTGKAPGEAGCSGYCEVRLTKTPGQEVPFSTSACQQDTTCTLAQSTSITFTNTVSFDGGLGLKRRALEPSDLLKAFNLGASYSYSKSVTYTVGTVRTQELGKNQCGYWTLIPYMMGSCGTLTTSDTGYLYNLANKPGTAVCSTKYHDTINYCNVTPYVDANGHADGQPVFVWLDCSTGALLPLAKQDPAYQHPGVSTGIIH